MKSAHDSLFSLRPTRTVISCDPWYGKMWSFVLWRHSAVRTCRTISAFAKRNFFAFLKHIFSVPENFTE